MEGPVVTGFLLLSVGKPRHRACAERWGARHGRQPALSHHQGLPAWGVVSVVLSLPQHQVDPRPPQGVEVVAHVMPSPRELATAFPLLTQSQPARWALQNHSPIRIQSSLFCSIGGAGPRGHHRGGGTAGGPGAAISSPVQPPPPAPSSPFEIYPPYQSPRLPLHSRDSCPLCVL